MLFFESAMLLPRIIEVTHLRPPHGLRCRRDGRIVIRIVGTDGSTERIADLNGRKQVAH